MLASYVVQNSSHQVLEERWISSTPFMLMNQMNHQDSGSANLQKLNSNPWPLLLTLSLWFQLSWGDLIIMPLIMMMLNITLHTFQLNFTINKFQIHTALQLNQFMMMKCIISWNSSIQNMMKIFWMLTSIFFKLDCWLPLLQNSIYSILFCFINMEEKMFQSQIACHTFLFLSQPRPLWNWLMETR